MTAPDRSASAEEWIIHSLNIHGTFFERWCQKVVNDSNEWTLRSANYAVEYAPPGAPGNVKEGELDIWAQLQVEGKILNLVVECKKNNPEFIDWIFLPSGSGKITRLVVLRTVAYHELPVSSADQASGTPEWVGGPGVTERDLGLELRVARDPREARGKYEDAKNNRKTRTSNEAVTHAARQVSLATNAVIEEEVRYTEARKRLVGVFGPPVHEHVFLPMIITTARLFICTFDASDVDSATGEISRDKASLTEHPYLLFECPLPPSLQGPLSNTEGSIVAGYHEGLRTMPIVVVHSEAFPQLLQNLAANGRQILLTIARTFGSLKPGY